MDVARDEHVEMHLENLANAQGVQRSSGFATVHYASVGKQSEILRGVFVT